MSLRKFERYSSIWYLQIEYIGDQTLGYRFMQRSTLKNIHTAQLQIMKYRDKKQLFLSQLPEIILRKFECYSSIWNQQTEYVGDQTLGYRFVHRSTLKNIHTAQSNSDPNIEISW